MNDTPNLATGSSEEFADADAALMALEEFRVASAAANADLDVTTIAGDTVWRTSDSPIRLKYRVDIPPGSSLTIEPGVTVLFGSASTLYVHPGGTLIAKGSRLAPIVLTSASPPTPWQTIYVLGTANLSYVHVSYAGPMRHVFVGAILVETTGRFEMDNSRVSGNLGHGLFIGSTRDGQPEACTVSRSVIEGNGLHGIRVSVGYVDVMDGTVVRENGDCGIYNLHAGYTGRPMSVMNSDIVDNNGTGIFLHSNPEILVESQSYGHGNNIHGNGGKQLASFADWHLVSGDAKEPERQVDWSDNYWGAPMIENGCGWSTARWSTVHISPTRQLPCSPPPPGPVNHSAYPKEDRTCPGGITWCSVDVVNAASPASEPFKRIVQLGGPDQL